jgi:hypothetical protein
MSISKIKKGSIIYLRETISYWDKKKQQSRNTQTYIGKIDNATGEPIYNQKYLDLMEKKGTPIKINPIPRNINNLTPIDFEGFKNYGVHHFLLSISEKIKIFDCLKEIFPKSWKQIYTIACFLVSSNRPLMYLDEWIEDNESLNVGAISSQRVSEILSSFTIKEHNNFYKLWINKIKEKEYIALDITSVSPYSKEILEVERGKNQITENLPQVNICMMYGEKTYFPMYQRVFQGSMTLKRWNVLLQNFPVLLVTVILG